MDERPLTQGQRTRIAEQDHEAARAESLERLRFQVGIADAAMKALTLANGGALVALFTLIGALGGRDSVLSVDAAKLWVAFGLFVAGLVAALFVHLFAFLSQDRFYAQATEEAWRAQTDAQRGTATPPSQRERDLMRWGMRSYVAAIVIAVVSVILFATGAGFALASFLPS